MQGPPDESEIQKLLEGLRSHVPNIRREAAETVLEREIRDERVLEALKAVAARDPNRVVRSAASAALYYAGVREFETAGQPPEPPVSAEAAIEEEPVPDSTKLRGFLIGFLGWFLVNGAMWFMIVRGSSYDFSAACLTFGANVLLLIIFAINKRTRWIALGILSALALNLLISLVRGLTFNGICFIPFFFDTVMSGGLGL